MYVHISVCMCMYVHVLPNTYSKIFHVGMCMYLYVYMHVSVCICMYQYIYACITLVSVGMHMYVLVFWYDLWVSCSQGRACSAVGRAHWQGLVSQGSGFDPDLFHKAYYIAFVNLKVNCLRLPCQGQPVTTSPFPKTCTVTRMHSIHLPVAYAIVRLG
jgi:hypothetical protein